MTESKQISRRRFSLGLTATAAVTLATPHIARAAAGLDPLIGNMLLLGFLGSDGSASWAQRLARQISLGQAGGAVFLGHNFKSRAGVNALTQMFESAGNGSLPLVMLDQEGGAVQRLGKKLGYKSVPRAREVAQTMSTKQAKALYAGMAGDVRGAGFNFNLAPVVDMDVDPTNPVIGKWGRAWGKDPKTVTAYATSFIEAHRAQGLACSLKHFPGHGSSRGDSHDGFVDITDTWSRAELKPFEQLIGAGEADAVMTAHLYHRDFAGSTDEPVTLSHTAIEGVLRSELGFTGTVMTDDLDMGAIRSRYSLEEAVVRAIAAGNDLVMLSNSAKPDDDLPSRMIETVKAAVTDGRIKRARIEEAHQRIAALKGRISV